jgi:hypothetical protein
MRHWVAIVIGALALGFAPDIHAQINWDGIAPPLVQGHLTVEWNDPGGEEPLDGCNLKPKRVHYSTYIAPHWKFAYHPIHDFWVERVEIIAGGATGKVQVEILEANGRGGPPGFVLATGIFQQVEKHCWQGTHLKPSVLLLKGHEYHLKCSVVQGGFISAAGTGTKIADHFSYDGSLWTGPHVRLPWSIRFFGHLDPSAAEAASWGGIKSLYR